MTMGPTRLWAKSKRDDEAFAPSMLLPGHLMDVYAAAKRVLTATGDDQLSALGLDCSAYRERLEQCVLLAAAAHDLGKANDHFQGMIRGARNVQQDPQGLRHEWATLLMLRGALKNFLLPAVGGCEADFAIVEWAIAGHHPGHDSPPKTPPAGGGVEMVAQFGHHDFRIALEWLKDQFTLGSVPIVVDVAWCLEPLEPSSVFAEIKAWAKDAKRRWGTFETSEQRFVAAVKNTLIGADVAGSALPKELPDDPNRWQWIRDSFAAKPKSGDLRSVVEGRRKGFQKSEPQREQFQNAVADSPARVTFVKAGCGSGKTLAAYMWAAKNCETRRLFFCYPTTGTATEGFKDYLFEPDVDADLFHSRRAVDFEIVLNVSGDTTNSDADAALRIEALDTWSTPIVACTVDTVLGLMQNNKRGLFAWPALAQSAFVFDEIHAYDDRLFGALLRFLRDLPGLPVLLMTASLPQARHQALERELRRAIPPIAGPSELEERKRYRRMHVVDNDPLPLVRETWASGGKVLWVCNTVKRVIDTADRATACGLRPLVYHSRFKYEDRVHRHKNVIDAFKGSGSALAICSQVAEMSLDLSADLLVTDLAPVPALIQRLGRLNRRAEKDCPWPFVVVEPDGRCPHLPYTPEDLAGARNWLGKLGLCGLSQRDLAGAWEQTGDRPPDSGTSAWLDGGPTTTVTELREASPGITVLMAEDLARIRLNRRDLGKFTLPMPQTNLPWHTWRRERGLPVAPTGSIIYDAKRGAEWVS